MTVTTVGYGDVYPVTLVGKIFSSLLMVLGSVLIFLPMLFVVNTFVQVYVKNVDVNNCTSQPQHFSMHKISVFKAYHMSVKRYNKNDHE